MKCNISQPVSEIDVSCQLQCFWICEAKHCGVFTHRLIFSWHFSSPLQMLCHCSLRSAVIVVGVKSVSRTPRSSWRSWRKSMQPASSSPKTREGASRPPPTSQSVKSPSGFKTDESRRKNLSVNPRALTCTLLDKISDLLFETATHTFQKKPSCHIFYLLHRKIVADEHFGSVFFSFNLSSIIDHANTPPVFNLERML